VPVWSLLTGALLPHFFGFELLNLHIFIAPMNINIAAEYFVMF